MSEQFAFMKEIRKRLGLRVILMIIVAFTMLICWLY